MKKVIASVLIALSVVAGIAAIYGLPATSTSTQSDGEHYRDRDFMN